MRITLKLFAQLTDYLPVEARHTNVIEVDVAPQATISQIIEPYGMPPKLVHLVLLNGSYIAPAQRLTQALQPGDVLAIWPPIAGG
ncbi:MoaD/ThiS family protein [Rhodoferax sp.]|uniref:MoaD/ThiS family protein n=1 Tax=Rhodoferax sp. TaxID=50421 RepID=UPI00277280E9|nr:MoaD/ThiS family protein [Rhodoferax sp.]